MFTTVAYSILSLCIMTSFGYFFSKKKILDEKAVGTLSYLLLNLSMPCMVLTTMQIDFSMELLKDALICFAVFAAIMLFGGLFAAPTGKALGLKGADKRAYAAALAFPNVMYIGFPVISGALGDAGLFYAVMCSIIFNLLCFTAGIKLIAGKSVKLKLSQILSPACVSSIVGFAFFILGVRLWPPLYTAAEGLARTTVPLSALIIGAMLAKSGAKDVALDFRLYAIAVAKLIIIPLVTYFTLRLFIGAGTLTAALTLLSGMPAATVTAVFAQNNGGSPVFASKMVFTTTVLAMITLPLLAWLAG